MLKHLVDQQNFSATFLKLVGKVYDAMPREIEIVHVDEQTGTVGSESVSYTHLTVLYYII